MDVPRKLKKYIGERTADAELVEGYLDGFNPNSREPSASRSHNYHLGFAYGRDDQFLTARSLAAELRYLAEVPLPRGRSVKTVEVKGPVRPVPPMNPASKVWPTHNPSVIRIATGAWSHKAGD